MVIDPESGKVIGDIPGQKVAHGVAIVPKAGRGFISDGGGDGAIVIFDLKTHAVLGTLTALPDADGIISDPTSGRVLVVSGRGKALMSFPPDIDPGKGKIDPPIALRGEPEFLAADESGKVYINLMDTNEVTVVDLKTRKVLANWPVAPGGRAGGDVHRYAEAVHLHRLPEATEADRDEHGRRKDCGGPADRRGRRRDKTGRRTGFCKLPGRYARGGRRNLAGEVRNRRDNEDTRRCADHGRGSHLAPDLSADCGIRAGAKGRLVTKSTTFMIIVVARGAH
jgi:hypothetical protein